MSSHNEYFDGSGAKVAADLYQPLAIGIGPGPPTPSDMALFKSVDSAFQRFSSSPDQARDHRMADRKANAASPTNLEDSLRQAMSNHFTGLVMRRAYLGQLVASLISAISGLIYPLPTDSQHAIINCLESAVLTLIGHPALIDVFDAIAVAISAKVIMNVNLRAMDDSSVVVDEIDHIGVCLNTDTEKAVKGFAKSVTAQMRGHVAVRNALTDFSIAAIRHSISRIEVASPLGERAQLVEDAVKTEFGNLSRLAAVGDALQEVAKVAADDAVSRFNAKAPEV